MIVETRTGEVKGDTEGDTSVTERVFVLPPASQLGPITPQQRQALIAQSLVAGIYEKVVDRESAYEKLKGRTADAAAQAPAATGAGKTAAGDDANDGGGLLGGSSSVLNSRLRDECSSASMRTSNPMSKNTTELRANATYSQKDSTAMRVEGLMPVRAP